MVSETEKFLVSYWDSRPAVRRNAARDGNMTLAEKLAWQDALRRHLALTGRTQHVLDVGTGTGAVPRLLAELRVAATGVDWSQQQLDVARQRWQEIQHGVRGKCTFIQADVHTLDFENAAFDSVVAVNVLTQLLNPQKALHEWARVLKPGGKLVIVEDDRNSAETRQAARRLARAELADDPQGKQLMQALERCPLWQADGAEIGAALSLTGFEQVDHFDLAGQLVRQGRWRLQRYEIGYMLISAEKSGSIPLT